MSSNEKRSPHEAWDALQDSILTDETERVVNLSDAALDAELARGGLDPKAVRAKGAAIGRSLGKMAPVNRSGEAVDETRETGAWVSAPPPPVPLRPLDRRWVPLLAGTLALVAIGGGAVALGLFNKHDPPTTKDWPDAAPSATSPPAPAPSPRDFRETPAGLEDKPRPRP